MCICYSNRAEIGLLEPIIRRLKESKDFKVTVLDLHEMLYNINDDTLGALYEYCHVHFRNMYYDYILCPFDRREVMYAALGAFQSNQRIISLFSGDKSQQGLHDDFYRPAIALMATIQFCASENAHERTVNLLEAAGKPTNNCHNIGSTHLDDFTMEPIPELEGPEYDLVLYHPPTRAPDTMPNDIAKLLNSLQSGRIILLNPNGDKGSEIISKTFQEWGQRFEGVTYYPDGLPRPQFLWALNNCKRFIGNSSAIFYEANYFLEPEQIVHIGVRNLNREYVDVKPGASDRFLEILKAEGKP